jgi:hypothetical protein
LREIERRKQIGQGWERNERVEEREEIEKQNKPKICTY